MGHDPDDFWKLMNEAEKADDVETLRDIVRRMCVLLEEKENRETERALGDCY